MNDPVNEKSVTVEGGALSPEALPEGKSLSSKKGYSEDADAKYDSAGYFTLKVRITGLCAAVICEDGTVKILLVNEQAKGRHESGGHHQAEPHVGALITHKRHLSGRGRDTDFGFDGSSTFFNSPDMIGFLLQEESIEVDGLNGMVNLDRTPRDGSCPSKRDEGSLEWCPQMHELGAASVSTPAFYHHDVPLVKSQMILKGGNLRTSSFAKDHSGRILKWVFKGGSAVCSERRALAEEVEYSVKIKSSKAVFVTRNNFPEGCLDDIVLVPCNGEVLCWVVNQPMEDILLDRERLQRKPITHFEKYFQLSSSDCAPLIPYPLYDVCLSDVGGASSPRCPVAFFERLE